ncbi:hypothetical protein BpHYR1_044418 [Brachionus plicatilis]|uniref:Uncharacterized protein n=1 Tax=Brachionus plicatilis TaxID=10195 RepID=A0A3M7RGI3_BRAPC|nr:hypothetical protein BpHYR1_044418 [Brachionus plicatilis]
MRSSATNVLPAELTLLTIFHLLYTCYFYVAQAFRLPIKNLYSKARNRFESAKKSDKFEQEEKWKSDKLLSRFSRKKREIERYFLFGSEILKRCFILLKTWVYDNISSRRNPLPESYTIYNLLMTKPFNNLTRLQLHLIKKQEYFDDNKLIKI